MTCIYHTTAEQHSMVYYTQAGTLYREQKSNPIHLITKGNNFQESSKKVGLEGGYHEKTTKTKMRKKTKRPCYWNEMELRDQRPAVHSAEAAPKARLPRSKLYNERLGQVQDSRQTWRKIISASASQAPPRYSSPFLRSWVRMEPH